MHSLTNQINIKTNSSSNGTTGYRSAARHAPPNHFGAEDEPTSHECHGESRGTEQMWTVPGAEPTHPETVMSDHAYSDRVHPPQSCCA